MSKKKSATTMTLKDFHGGSIPSDLPLPSAPGVSVKLSQERTTGVSARSERTRHMSASSAAISPLPVPPRVIGRHFDEDERTPFDAPPRAHAAMPVASGAWAQRKEQSNPAAGLTAAGSGTGTTTWSPSRVAQASALEKVISGRWHSSSRVDQMVAPVSESEIRPTGDIGFFGLGDSYAPQTGVDQRAVPYGSILSENRIRPPVAQNKVLSGPGYGFDVTVPDQTRSITPGYVHFSGVGSDQRNAQHPGVIGERTRVVGSSFGESYGHGSGLESKQRPVARTGVIGDNRVKSPIGPPEMRRVVSGSGSGSEEMYGFGTNKKHSYNNWEERPRSVGLMERKDMTGLGVDSEVNEIERPASHGGRFVAEPTAKKEGTERPRLKLLPRTKPIESQEIRVTEDKVSELHANSNVLIANDLHEMHINENAKANKGGNAMADSGIQPNERPRLNLKPRSQAVGAQSAETGGKERPSVFGGARPRELVLKERGVDLTSDDIDKNVPSNRPDSSSGKPDLKTEQVPAKPVSRPENYQLQQKNICNPHTSPKEHHHHHAKHQHQPDTQRSTWRNDAHNATNSKRATHQQPPHPEPDTWRKPEPVKQEEVVGQRPGKGASALELAEAFSKRVSDGKRDSVGRNPNPVVFSRLLGGERELYKGPPPHQQINGY